MMKVCVCVSVGDYLCVRVCDHMAPSAPARAASRNVTRLTSLNDAENVKRWHLEADVDSGN